MSVVVPAAVLVAADVSLARVPAPRADPLPVPPVVEEATDGAVALNVMVHVVPGQRAPSSDRGQSR